MQFALTDNVNLFENTQFNKSNNSKEFDLSNVGARDSFFNAESTVEKVRPFE